jgi:formamidopyrimidine-DNA glycosylase
MPEIAEIARIVNFLKAHLVNKRITKVLTQEDDIVYGKVGCSASAFSAALTNKTIVDVRQQGKYFWLEMSSSPHALMHFGMTGWIYMKDVWTPYFERSSGKDATRADDWPPKYWKWHIVAEDGTEAAFVDTRRLGRIRLVDVPAEQMRKTTPLKENGPDPAIDKDVLTKEWLRNKLRSKRVPIKALLLDQANISGIGNWVG